MSEPRHSDSRHSDPDLTERGRTLPSTPGGGMSAVEVYALLVAPAGAGRTAIHPHPQPMMMPPTTPRRALDMPPGDDVVTPRRAAVLTPPVGR